MAVDLGKMVISKGATRQPPSEFAQFLAEGMMLGVRPSTHVINPQAVQQVKQDAAKSQFLSGMLDRLKLGVLGAAQGAGAGNFLSEEMNRRSQAQEAQLAAAKAQEDLRRWNVEQNRKQSEDESQKKYREWMMSSGVSPFNQIPEGMEVTGYDVKGRPMLRKSEEVKAVEAQRRKDVSALKAYVPDYKQVSTALDQLEKAARDLGDFETGVVPQAVAKGKLAVEGFAKSNKALNMFESVVAEKLIPMARKVMEEKGPITEFDVSRVEKALGDKTLPLDQKLEIINRFRSQLNAQLTSKAELAGEDVSKFIKTPNTGKTKSGVGYTIISE